AARCAVPARRVRREAAGDAVLAVRSRLVRAARGGGAAVLPRARRGLRARGRAARRPRSSCSLGAPDDALRPRLPAGSATLAVLVSQAPARVPSGRGGATLPAALCARHVRARAGVLARARARAVRRSGTRRRAGARLRRSLRRSRHFAALSGPDRLPRAASLRVRAPRAGGV